MPECILSTLNILILLIVVFLSLKSGYEKFVTPDTKIILFWRPGCGYCENLKRSGGEWEQFKRQYKGNLYEINTQNPTADDQIYIKKERQFMQGVPHIVKYKNNLRHEYVGNRSAASLLAWANS